MDQYAHIFWSYRGVEDNGDGTYSNSSDVYLTVDKKTALANVHRISIYNTCFELRPDKHKTPVAQFSWFEHKGVIIGAIYFNDDHEDQCFAMQNGKVIKTQEWFCNELTDEEAIGDELEACFSAFASDILGERILVGFDSQNIPLAQVYQDIIDYIEEYLAS
jgi:hypothetical protein